jgi:hypothetical protein
MSPRDLAPAALGGLAAVAALSLLVQLSSRADDVAGAVSAVRRDGRSVSVLVDRAAGTGLVGVGWDWPILNQGATSNAAMAYVILPTSTAAGDLELTLVLAGGAPTLRDRPVRVAIGPTPVGHWTPKSNGEETIRLRVPAAARAQSYEVTAVFDLTDGRPGPTPPPPIRLIKASTRVVPAS